MLFGCEIDSAEINKVKKTLDDAPIKPKLIAYSGYTGRYDHFTLMIDERFNKLDNTIWEIGDGAVGSEAMCRFNKQGVLVQNGLLHLIIDKAPIPSSWSEDHQQMKPAYDYYCGELRSKHALNIRYGRIEARVKAPKRQRASGYIASLFTYNFAGDPKEWEEIDVELEGGRPDKFQANLIYGAGVYNWTSTRAWGAWEDKIKIGPVDEWRVYAIEWLPQQIRWFVDGNLVKILKHTDINCSTGCNPPQKYPTPIPDDFTQIMMNFWIPNNNIEAVFGGVKSKNIYPMTTQYDWVRYYKLNDFTAN